MSEIQKSEYCRKKRLYREQVEAWRSACEHANGKLFLQSKALQQNLKTEKERVNVLEKELIKQEKALAEAAAILLLQKKAQAIWGDHKDE